MTISDLLPSEDALLPNTDVNYMLIKREKGIQQEYEILQVNLEDLLTSEDSNQNLFLNERDEIIFFPSQLNTELIETIAIEESTDDETRLFGPVYANKSLGMEKINATTEEEEAINNINLDDSDPINKKSLNQIEDESMSSTPLKYYTYNVYEYCQMTKDDIESVLIDEKVSDEIELEIELSENKEYRNQNYLLTKICREKLIRPVIEIMDSQSSSEEAKQLIEVYGNVDYPGIYPLAVNATLREVLYSAGGIKDLSFTDEIEITKKNISGKEVLARTLTVNTDSLDQSIDPLDIITVKKYSEQLSLVRIEGEVFFPGVYPVSKNESLLQLIKRAGGLTEKANTGGIFFSRQSLAEQELKRLETAKRTIKKANTFSGISNLIVMQEMINSLIKYYY